MKAIALVLLLVFAAAVPGHETAHIDSAHSHARFAVRMLWVRQVEGRVDKLRGTVSMDDSGHARVSVTINVAQIHMDTARYKTMLLSEDFFDAARHPSVHFQSRDFATRLLRDGGDITGTLTMRGVTHAVQFKLLPAECGQVPITDCLVRVQGVVERSNYGMTAHRFTVADNVQLQLAIRLQHAAKGTPAKS